jgi:hypothetical protein
VWVTLLFQAAHGAFSVTFSVNTKVGYVPISAAHDLDFSVSFGEIFWLGKDKFLNFGFCRSHHNIFAKADHQIQRLGVSCVPKADSRNIKVSADKRPLSDI